MRVKQATGLITGGWFANCGAARLAALAAIVVLLLPTAAWAQLTKDDIEALRKQGEREGWTFTVGENEATQ